MDCSGRPWLAAFEPGVIASSRSAASSDAFASAAVISMWYSCGFFLSATVTVTVTVIHVFGAAIAPLAALVSTLSDAGDRGAPAERR
jgi:hypothetical protein